MNESVRDKAAELASSAKEQARSQFDEKKGTALGELDSLASALRRAGSELGDQGGMSGRVISTVATRLESFSRSLDGKDLDGVVRDVETFARRNPAAFLGSAVAIGFLASRFLKSSASPLGSSYGRDDFYSNEAYSGMGGNSPIGTAYGRDFTMREPAGTSPLDRPSSLGTQSALDDPTPLGSPSGLGTQSGLGTKSGGGVGTTGGFGTTGSGLGSTGGSGTTGSGLGSTSGSGTSGSGLGSTSGSGTSGSGFGSTGGSGTSGSGFGSTGGSGTSGSGFGSSSGSGTSGSGLGTTGGLGTTPSRSGQGATDTPGGIGSGNDFDDDPARRR